MIKSSQKLNYEIRPMQERDIPQALVVDQEAFPAQWPHPTYATFKNELRNRLARYIVACKQNEITFEANTKATGNKTFLEKMLQFNKLFDHDRFFGKPLPPPSRELILGIAGFWLMAGEAHITTIATRNASKRLGIGERLLITIINIAIEMNANFVTLEVRVSNKHAQSLYNKYGFVEVGMRKKYYSDNSEDALIMNTDIITTPSFQTNFKRLKEDHERRWGPYIVS